ncbi:hypothetical protein EG68_01354 [Paragonimus skrjabini miyazakii]|uniref:Uncharacterized protein n=1 Tax=Paragonimus skrjabini miyazakii TaxID=59628 RepID=A0A8S9ZCD0_9TREM|nr:hypothetical protein EG68_01354 [Paragonimus skrjabini miyazakii]
MFSLGQLVLAKGCFDDVEKGIADCILRRTGRVTYDVKVQSSIWVSHASQLRPSFQPVTVPSSRVIPLEILLDTSEPPRRFGCRFKSRGTSSRRRHTQKMDGSFLKTSCAHAGDSLTTILRAINSRARC